ncbi:hypothetical protein LZ30DRAFT_148733 [Colletotrichum cereale]|nr:hypothetical protein LZ30DRAFT_148733 [Colletotrichum cereale]
MARERGTHGPKKREWVSWDHGQRKRHAGRTLHLFAAAIPSMRSKSLGLDSFWTSPPLPRLSPILDAQEGGRTFKQTLTPPQNSHTQTKRQARRTEGDDEPFPSSFPSRCRQRRAKQGGREVGSLCGWRRGCPLSPPLPLGCALHGRISDGSSGFFVLVLSPFSSRLSPGRQIVWAYPAKGGGWPD